MIYWTYQPKLKHYLNENLRSEIKKFPKGTQSQKQASSHYDGYNQHKLSRVSDEKRLCNMV